VEELNASSNQLAMVRFLIFAEPAGPDKSRKKGYVFLKHDGVVQKFLMTFIAIRTRPQVFA
jgi:hypothetical protein